MQDSIRWPLISNRIRKGSTNNTFGMVRNNKTKAHQGWDFEASVGTSAYALGKGTVIFTRNHGAYGLQACISFEHGGKTYYAFYAHMKSLAVKKGDSVHIHQEIGRTGKSGNASNLKPDEDHLHFEIRTHAECGLGLGGRVSPITIFGVCPLHSSVYSPLPSNTLVASAA